MRYALIPTLLLMTLATPAGAAEPMKECSHMKDCPHMMMADHAGQMNQSSTSAFSEAMTTMHQAMAAVVPTGDMDVDFVRGMIPHHQGAIDMAKVVLEKGADPQIKALATGIIKAQEDEIKMMQEWLKAHPVPASDVNTTTQKIPHGAH